MNIKSLLLGSAAAAVAVSAQAADAIVIAEPEPMEYVRICDTYGTGYFYIPGTETCLKIGGYVRYDMTHWDNGTSDSFTKLARLATTFDVRNSTEWGTLRSYGEVEFDWFFNTNATPNAYANRTTLRHAFIDIGDQNFLRIGKAWNGLRSWVPTASTIDDQQISVATYNQGQVTYVFNGTNGAGIGGGLGFSGFISAVADDDATYDPIVEAGIGYGWGPRANTNFLRLAAGYDSENGSAMVRAGVDATFGVATAKLSVHYVNDETGYYFNALSAGTGLNSSNWAVVGGLDIRASDTVTVNLAAGWYDDGRTGALAEREWEVAGGVNWQPFKNNSLQIRPEVRYVNNRTTDDAWGARIRFQRNF